MSDAQGRPVVLITGGSRGIGAATAVLAAQQGFDVCFSYTSRSEAADAVAARCRDAGAAVLVAKVDVTDESALREMFERCRADLGRPAAVINNAGILGPSSRLDDMDVARIRRTFEVNVIGAFVCAQEAIRAMSTAHGGAGGTLVNVSSIASRLGSGGEYVDYAATKGAMDTMTIGLAKEVAAEGIRVVAVRPGLIETDIHAEGRLERLADSVPLGRVGTAEEVAATIMWLTSPEASYVTGSLLDVGGGR